MLLQKKICRELLALPKEGCDLINTLETKQRKVQIDLDICRRIKWG